MRPIDADALKRRAQKVATEAWKMKLDAKIETTLNQFIEWIDHAKTIEPEQQWIPCTPDTMPDDLEEVYVTWVNHNPPWYYNEIKDKPFTAPAVYHRGKWYWYSSVCVDTLAEYGKNDFDEVDKDIEIVAWCKIPEPYGGEQE